MHTVVFDLGGVVIDWNPRYLFRNLLSGEEAVETFLATVCTQAWNEQQDAGRPLAEAVAELTAVHPDHTELIRAYYDRWDEMLGGLVPGTAAIIDELDRAAVPLYALSNWSAETFHHARARFEVLERFRGIVLSGEEGLIKPDPALFEVLFERHELEPAQTIFIDDVARNVEAARSLGMIAIEFTSASQLRPALVQLGLPVRDTVGP